MRGVELALVAGAGGTVERIGVARARPLIAPVLLKGLRPEDALKRAGLVFGLCPMAQTAALALALAAAGADVAQAPPLAVWRERVTGWIRAACLDAPAVLGAAPDPDIVRAALATPEPRALMRLARRAADRLEALADGLGPEPAPAPVRLVPRIDAGWALRRLDAPDFAARPTCADGAPGEVGPTAQWYGACTRAVTIADRLRARAAILRLALPDDPAVIAANGRACAVVETGRGPLALMVELAPDGTIARAASAAPTEWLLHPDGALAAALAGLPATDATVRHAARVIMSLDPCVDVRVKLHAEAEGRMAAHA